MKFRIELKINQTTQTKELNREHATVGRKNADLVLKDSHCSRNHARFYTNFDASLWIEDTNSTNGILVNGKVVQKAKLRDGDVIRIGQTEIRIIESMISSHRPEIFQHHYVEYPATV